MTDLDSVFKSRNITLPAKVHIVKAVALPVVVYRCELDHKEGWVQKNWCFWIIVLEKTLESPLDSKIKPVYRKLTLNIHWKDQCWSWSSNILAPWCEELTHWKRPWCWERLKARGEGGDRGWDGWMASLTQWTWVWAKSGRQWRTGSLVCCSLWGHKELDMTEQLNNTRKWSNKWPF